eukprot:11914-Heterococcus_DN1.PRE.2
MAIVASLSTSPLLLQGQQLLFKLFANVPTRKCANGVFEAATAAVAAAAAASTAAAAAHSGSSNSCRHSINSGVQRVILLSAAVLPQQAGKLQLQQLRWQPPPSAQSHWL